MSRAWTWALVGALLTVLTACDTAEERAEAHFQRGLELVEQGTPVKAQLEFRNALKLNKTHVQARYEFARIMRSDQDIRGALKNYLTIVELDGNFLPARLEIGEIFLLANRPEDAARHIEAALKLEPENIRARSMQATVDFKNGNVDLALERANAVLAEDPSNVTGRLVNVAYLMDRGELRKALAEIDKGLGLSPEDLSLNVVKLGIAEQLGDPEPVGQQLKILVRMFPKTNQFRSSLTAWHMGRNETVEAEDQLRALADNNPEDVRWSLDLVRFLGSIKGPAEARAELERLIASDHPHAEYQFALAAVDLSEGDNEQGMARLRAVVEKAGDTADGFKARVEVARYMIRSGDRKAGFAEIDYILEKDPRNVAALGIRAARFVEEDRPDLAINDLRAALDSDPDNLKLLGLLATAYERAGSHELAVERMAQAATVSNYEPQPTLRYVKALMAEGKDDVVESILRDALAKREDNREFLLTFAQLRLAKEDWREVQRIADRLRVLDPEDAAADRLIAASLVGQKMFSQSIDVLSEAVAASDGADIGAMMSLVRTYVAAGQVEEAESYLAAQIKENPGNPAALVLFGSLQAARGKLDEAEASFLRAIEEAPEYGVAYASLASIYETKGNQDEAKRQLEAGLEASGNDNLRLALAMRMEAAGDIDGAIDAYNTIYSRRSDSAIVANNLASLIADHRADDPAQLERAFNIAQRFRESSNPYMQDTYGWLLFLRGQPEQAVAALRPAAERLTSNALVQYHLGRVYEELKQLDRAHDTLARSIELAADAPFTHLDDAKAALARVEAARKALATPAPE
jgi:putative PEP-CTERM system TPR-repeat lipoprotein